MLDRGRPAIAESPSDVKGEHDFVGIQPGDHAVRRFIQTASHGRRARRRDEAIIQAELRRLAQRGKRVARGPLGATDREHDPSADRVSTPLDEG